MSATQTPVNSEGNTGPHDQCYVVQLFSEGNLLGAGFFVTPRFLLTAAHVLHHLPPDHRTVEIVHDGRRLQGRVAQRTSRFDVALIELVSDVHRKVRTPEAGRCQPRDDWSSPYRPAPTEPELTGSVEAVDITYQCHGGEVMLALELVSRLDLGDFSGYSGAPVERVTDAAHPTLAGLLLEQVWRRDGSLHRRPTASNVLFASTLAQALSCFDHFDVCHLVSVLTQTVDGSSLDDRRSSDTAVPSQATRVVKEADLLLNALDEWAARGILDDGQLALLRLRVASNVIDRGLA
ncbi:trypsin-like peptidase domain-containing protein [Micromonospora tulbaghiae]|uniref:trypsin-like peptidase domain-containing protein n=1 Tax=Micromonospora tulbaghiae TaxID=479978 RepID=UPI003EBE7783